MGLKKIVTKGLFSGLNPLRWMGFEHIADNAKTIKNIANGIAKPSPSEEKSSYRPKTFEAAMQHYGLTEADIQKRMRASWQISLACFLLSLPMLGYTVYLFIAHLPLSAFVCVILTGLLWAYAFREHFNYFQMKQRRLGCTFKEWFINTVSGKGFRR